METEDDRAWLEELFEDSDLLGNNPGKDNISRGGNGLLNPNAAVFVPKYNNLNANGLRVHADEDLPNTKFHLADKLAKPPANSPITEDVVDNPDGKINEPNNENNPDELNNRQNNRNHELADVQKDRRNDIQTRNRLQTIIQASEYQAERARLAYISLYGAVQNVSAEDDPGNRLNNNQHAIIVDHQNQYQCHDRALNENNAENRQRFRHNRARAVNHNNRFDNTRGKVYEYNRQEREYDDENSFMGPIRHRRGGRNQQERDAAYWRGRFFQLRNQNRKVKDFLFCDKF